MKLIEGLVVMGRLGESDICRLLKMKGTSRLEVKDDFTEKVLEQKDKLLLGGLKFRFIESKKFSGLGGEWVEYKILYSIPKYDQTLEFLHTVLYSIYKTLDNTVFSDSNIDYLEISEFDSSYARYYYFLLDVRRDIGEEIQENEIENLFKEYYYD